MQPHPIDFWWDLVFGTSIVLTMVVALVTVLLIHSRIKLKMRQEKVREVQASERKYQELFNNVSDIVYIHDLEGKILSVNTAVEKIVGYTLRDVEENTLFGFTRQQDHGRVREYLTGLRAAEDEIVGVLPLWSPKHQHVLLLEYRSSAIRLNGAAIAARGIARNITDRIRYEHHLERARLKVHALLEEARIAQEKLAQLSQESIRMQEEDRKWISRELHDEIGQYLTAITIDLQILKQEMLVANPALLKRIDDMKQAAEAVLGKIHNFLKEIRPVPLTELGLVNATKSLLEEFSKRTGILFTFHESRIIEKLGEDQKLALYRIIQESLNNIAKHAHATSGIVNIHSDPARVIVDIIDDGLGFDPEKQGKNTGLGIIGMGERVKLAHGELRVISSPGKGTCINVILPLSKD